MEGSRRPLIVLVESDAAVVSALKFSLDLEGFDVRAFADGETLLGSRPLPEAGCLVLNYHLPGIDGLVLLERLRAANVTLPATLISTNPRNALRARAALAGVPIIEKPLLTDALRDWARHALGQSRPLGHHAHPD